MEGDAMTDRRLDDDRQPCGCPVEYHLPDCEARRALTKAEYMQAYLQDLDDMYNEQDARLAHHD
jgi:hypothetical protein